MKILDVVKPSAKFLQDGAPVVSLHLLDIVYLSLKLNIFLSKCKIAKIKPLLKKGIKTETRNYEPTSLLALISKVIKKSIYD